MNHNYDNIIKDYENAIQKMDELIETYKPIAKKRAVNKQVTLARQKVDAFCTIKNDLEFALCKLKLYAEPKEDQK